MNKPIYRPIIWLSISMIVGILAGEAYPGHGLWVLVLAAVTLVFLVVYLTREMLVLLLPLFLFSSIGYLSIQPWVAPRFPDHHVRRLVDLETCNISGTILEEPVHIRNRTRFIMETVSIRQGGISVPACGRLRVTVSNDLIPLSRGDSISFFSRIRSIRNFNNPGGFDYERHMAYQNIWARSYVAAEKISVQSREDAFERISFFDDHRARVSGMIDAQALDAGENGHDVKAISKALLIGDRKEISSALREKFNRAGVGHLLAISGLHIGIVATVTFAIFRWVAAWFWPILWTGWTRRTAAILTFLPVLAYGFLAGMSPSTQRAVIMVSVFLLTLLFDRDQDLINSLCIAGMLILIINPPSLFSISFQLSFTAVLVIVCGLSLMRPILKKSEGLKSTLIAKGLVFMAVTLFATVGTAPLVMAYFNQVSIIGLVVNTVAIPLVGFIVVPLGLSAVFLQVFSTGAASVCLQLSHWVLEKAIRVIDFFSGLPVAVLETFTPSLVEISLFYLVLLGVFSWFSAGQQEKKSKRPAVLRRGIACGVIVFAAVGGALDAGYWLHHRFWHNDLRIMIFDVGQGSAALLELPRGRNLMIDGGGFSDNTVFDTGKSIIAPYLLRNKIKTIHTLFLSHPNSDHLNGLIYMAEHFNVKKVITNNETSSSKGYQLFVDTLDKHGIDAPRYRALERSTAFEGVRIEILYPAEDFLERASWEKWRNKNNNSLVLKVSYGQHAFLFPGDIMAMGEKTLVAAAGKNLKSTVLVSPHHGSGSSSTALLIEQVHPQIVVVSCGFMNRFHFPDKKVLKRYESLGCRTLRTDLHGAVSISTDGRKMKVRVQNEFH